MRYRSNEKKKKPTTLKVLSATEKISESQVPRFRRESYFTTSQWSLPQWKHPKQWLRPHADCIAVFYASDCVSEPYQQRRAQHSLIAALQIKRWMISTAVTCISHGNLKRRQTSRGRLLPGVGARSHKITDALPFSSLLLTFPLPMWPFIPHPRRKLNARASNQLHSLGNRIALTKMLHFHPFISQNSRTANTRNEEQMTSRSMISLWDAINLNKQMFTSNFH